ncbi:MAG: GNAT family N-acetyltransferase [Pseudomonas sp.]
MQTTDLDAAAAVHQAAFTRQRLSREWLACGLAGWPKSMTFVLTEADQVLGYCLWTQKSGFRPEAVLELEQIAVHPDCHSRGLGRALIRESLPQVRGLLEAQGAILKHVLITTRADNQAQRLYASELGAEVEAVVRNLYSADEVIMVSRHPPGAGL